MERQGPGWRRGGRGAGVRNHLIMSSHGLGLNQWQWFGKKELIRYLEGIKRVLLQIGKPEGLLSAGNVLGEK